MKTAEFLKKWRAQLYVPLGRSGDSMDADFERDVRKLVRAAQKRTRDKHKHKHKGARVRPFSEMGT